MILKIDCGYPLSEIIGWGSGRSRYGNGAAARSRRQPLPKVADRNRGILTLVGKAMDDESEEKLVEKVARELMDQHGPGAIPILRERAEAAELTGDKSATETWREIADLPSVFCGSRAWLLFNAAMFVLSRWAMDNPTATPKLYKIIDGVYWRPT